MPIAAIVITMVETVRCRAVTKLRSTVNHMYGRKHQTRPFRYSSAMATTWASCPSRARIGGRYQPTTMAGSESIVATQNPWRIVRASAARSPAPWLCAAKAPTTEITPIQAISRPNSTPADRLTAPSATPPTTRPMMSVSEKFIAISARKPAAIGAVIFASVRASWRHEGGTGNAITAVATCTPGSMGNHRFAVGRSCGCFAAVGLSELRAPVDHELRHRAQQVRALLEAGQMAGGTIGNRLGA